MSKTVNIEWFSVEEKEPPKFVKLFFATPKKIEFGFASECTDKAYPKSIGQIVYCTYNGLVLSDVRYWALIPSYPGDPSEIVWNSQWKTNHANETNDFEMFAEGRLIGVRFI